MSLLEVFVLLSSFIIYQSIHKGAQTCVATTQVMHKTHKLVFDLLAVHIGISFHYKSVNELIVERYVQFLRNNCTSKSHS